MASVLEALRDVQEPCRKTIEGVLTNAKGERVAVCSVVWAFSLKQKGENAAAT